MEVLRLTFIVVPKQKGDENKKQKIFSLNKGWTAFVAATVKYFLRRFKEVSFLFIPSSTLE